MRSRPLQVVLLFSVILILGFLTASAQIDDSDSCRSSCREAHTRCVTACGTHSDPIECEADCRDAAEDCESSCG